VIDRNIDAAGTYGMQPDSLPPQKSGYLSYSDHPEEDCSLGFDEQG
jgi:hypothetical protein